jgi:hypothetical protein
LSAVSAAETSSALELVDGFATRRLTIVMRVVVSLLDTATGAALTVLALARRALIAITASLLQDGIGTPTSGKKQSVTIDVSRRVSTTSLMTINMVAQPRKFKWQ